MRTIYGCIRSFHVIAAWWLMVGACAPGSQHPWTFAVIGDSRAGGCGHNAAVLGEIVGELTAARPDLVLFTGDLVHPCTATAAEELAAWSETMRPLYEAGIPVYPCRGNHDRSAVGWVERFGSDVFLLQKLPGNGPTGERYMTYTFGHRNALFAVLDQYAGVRDTAVHTVGADWLRGQLEGQDARHVFVMAHEPAFKAYHEDCMDDEPGRRERFLGVLREAGARVMFCGHDHFYAHAEIEDGDGLAGNNLHQFTVGMAGAPPYRVMPQHDGDNRGYGVVDRSYLLGAYGYTLVRVDGPEVQVEVYTRDAEAAESGWGLCDCWSYSSRPEAVEFADGALLRAVAAATGAAEPDAGDLARLTHLDAEGLGIGDLAGLQHARNLVELDLRGNEIVDVGALLGMVKLRRLDLRGNPLSRRARCVDVPLLVFRNPGLSVFMDRPGAELDGECAFALPAFAAFAAAWEDRTCGPENGFCGGADRNRDGQVEIDDLAEYLENWLLYEPGAVWP